MPWLPRISGMICFETLIDQLELEKQALAREMAHRGPAPYTLIDMLIALDQKICALRILSEDR